MVYNNRDFGKQTSVCGCVLLCINGCWADGKHMNIWTAHITTGRRKTSSEDFVWAMSRHLLNDKVGD
jgi:hypothetical protein